MSTHGMSACIDFFVLRAVLQVRLHAVFKVTLHAVRAVLKVDAACCVCCVVLQGLILSPAVPSGQLRVARLTERLQLSTSRHLEALKSLASGYWRFMRHPGWALSPDTPVRTLVTNV